MPDDNPSAPLALNDPDSAELRMRRALGLDGRSTPHGPQQRPEQARQRHRFVQDGGVPVTVLNPRHEPEGARERLGALEQTLEREKLAHAATRAALQEQERMVRGLQTRLTHAEMAQKEQQEIERRLRAELAELHARLLTAHEAAPHRTAPRAPERSEAAAPEPHAAEPSPAEPPAIDPGPARPAAALEIDGEKRKRGRPRIHPVPEPKPVRWWTPSFKAKLKG